MKELDLVEKNGTKAIDSREAAEMVGKRHTDLLRSIDTYKDILLNAKLRSVDFFIESTYRDSTGRELPNYLLTKKGCDMVANKMTGEKGVLFTAAYVTKFDELEKKQIDTSGLSPQLQMFNSLFLAMADQERQLKEINETVNKALTTASDIKDTFIQEFDNWRDEINRLFNKIQRSTSMPFQDLRTETYSMLERKAGCDLSARIRNMKKRLAEEGATKTKVNSVTKIDAIESDKRLKEIYSQIIKEYAIKYTA